MTTSLAEQLKRLAAPQTSLLKHSKKRASLLFDPSEAANYDRQTIYDIALGGFVELKSINEKFSEFEDTLYSQTSISFERSVETKEVNANIDKSIKKFLHLLSPYLLLKASLRALEWLVNRYHIHMYNVDDLIMLALPYHETRLFVRILQVISLSDKTGRWHWLRPLQKPGVPLSKTALLNHCASSPSFLKLLCDTTLEALKVHGKGASALSTLTAFYCTTIIGGLEHSKKVSELQITHLLEGLICGYASKSVDFVAASYMITAQLVTKAFLSTEILNRLVTRIVLKLRHPELLPDCTLLLIIVFQTQEQSITDIPVKAVLRLGNSPNFPKTLGDLAGKGNRVTPLLVPVIRQALNIIQSQDDTSTSMKTLVEDLLTDVKLDEDDADAVVRAVIAGYRAPEDGMSDVTIDKDDLIKWYASFLQRLERAYPTVFDAAVCRTLKGEGISDQRAKDLKVMLGFELPLDLLDKLHHPNSKVRASAARSLSTKCSTFTEKDLQALHDSLGNFLMDDDPGVVSSALSFPPSVLKNIMGTNLRKALIHLLKRCVVMADVIKWSTVIGTAVKILCNLEIESGPEEIETLLALLPHFNKDNVVENTLASNFANQNKLLSCIRKLAKTTDHDSICSALVDCLSMETNLVKPEDVFEVAKMVKEQACDDSRWYVDRFFTSLLLAASVPNQADPSLCIKILAENDCLLGSKEAVFSGKKVELHPLSLSAGLNTCCEQKLPIQCCFHSLALVNSRVDTTRQNQETWFDLQVDSDHTKLLIELYRKILTGCAHPSKDVGSAYTSQMKLFFAKHCTTIHNQVAFLFSVSTFHEISAKPEHLELSIRSLRLAEKFLSGRKDCLEWSLQGDSESNTIPAVLLALQCSSPAVRQVACDVTSVLTQASTKQSSNAQALLLEILSKQEEISVDENQLRLVLHNTLSPDYNRQKKFQKEVLSSLLKCVLSGTTPTHVTSGLLRALVCVNSEEMLNQLMPLVHRSLELASKSDEADRFCSEILQNVLGRLNAQTCGCLARPSSWAAVVAAFKDQKTPILSPSGKIIRPAVVICQQIDQSLWEALPKTTESLQEKLLTLLLQTGSVAEYPEVISSVSAVFRRIAIDSATVVPTLIKMKDVQVQEPETKSRRSSMARKSLHKAPSPLILHRDEWRQGMALLEFLQNKKKLNNVHLLIPILFDLLKRCLEFEEQAPVEYAKQILLSCILLCCTKISTDEKQPAKNSAINVELVVQCIRASQNPQTHHHALLVLTHLADIVPDQVLHNVMAIFTFMGSLVLRQDDAYSFQVTSKILETIIPVLVKSGNADNQGKLDEIVASVLRVFVDALLDVPEHRRLSLYHKLLSTLDANRFLWIFLCLVFESHVVHARSDTSEPKRKGANALQMEVPKRLEVALQLVNQFSPETIFTNCVALVQYVRMLPMEKDEKSGRRPPLSPELAKYNISTLYNVEQNTPKVLRHYKYTIVTFLSALLSSMPLVSQVSAMEEESVSKMEQLYHSFLASLLSYIQVLNRQVDSSKSAQTAKYWSVMLGQTCEILDKVNALLPSSMFVTVISGLLTHSIQLLRRKALELLNARLSPAQNKSFMLTCDSEQLLTLLKPLVNIVSTIEVTQNGTAETDEEMDDNEKTAPKKNIKEEVLLTQQTALFSIKILARQLAYDHREKFIPILEMVTNLLKKRAALNDNILASLILCCSELCSALKAHAIVALPALMPSIIEVLSEYTTNLIEAPHIVLLSVVSAVLRVVETLPNFISRYLNELLQKVCVLLSYCTKKVSEEGDACKLAPVVTKLTSAGQKISTSVPSRVLIPEVSQCYKVLLKSNAHIGIGPLLTILSDSFAGLNPADLRNHLSELTDFFFNALNYRHECALKNADKEAMSGVETVEGHVIKTWVSLVLKLSETSFKPLYYKLYDWATRLDSHKDRVITFYRLSYSVSDCLKGLFPTYSGYFLKNAGMLLDQCNVTKVGEPDETEFNDQEEKRPAELYFGSGEVAEKKCAYLVEHILNTFKNVFLYDSHDFVTKETFEGLVRPIIDQLENTVGGMESLKCRAEKVLLPCIAQFAVALDDDIMWKQINYLILLKTKHKNPQIRLISLEAACKVVHKLGESFLPLIPETMPFLAELLEDEDENVEKACRHAVQDLEQVLGEPLQKYF